MGLPALAALQVVCLWGQERGERHRNTGVTVYSSRMQPWSAGTP